MCAYFHVTITRASLQNHVHTWYILRYNSSTTHPNQPRNTSAKKRKRKRKRNKDCPEVVDSRNFRACPQKTADIDGLRYSPDDPHYGPGLSIRLFMFELRETGDWDIFLGPPERARTETGGTDQWVLKRRKCSGFARVNKVTSTSLGYPLSVFNKLYSQSDIVIYLVQRLGWVFKTQRRKKERKICFTN